jgi:4-amino-4-deoxy-L-arabinose transferase-like glycosyltransferase
LSGKNSHTIQSLKPDVTSNLIGGLSSFFFILLSLSLIPYAGIQEDEALFSVPFYQPVPRELRFQLFHHKIPLMVMTYVGGLKTWIYWPLVHWFGSSVWTVRLPVVLLGAITVFVFFHLIRAIGTQTGSAPRWAVAASAGALLLATDPVFLLTNTFDWGPVALEHVLMVSGCFLLLRFATDQSQIRLLALGSFCFGLALWNKGLFLWALSGLAAGALAVFWPEVKQCLTPRNAKIASAAFLAGALPFVVYNLRSGNATLSQNAHFETDRMASKWLQLERAANGSSLFGYMASEDYDGPLKPPPSWRGRMAEWIWRRAGEHRESYFFYVFGGMLLLAPLWWRWRAARFSLVFLIVAWLAMALTKNAGASAHHVILLWPFPILFAVSVLASIPWRWLAIVAAAGMVLMNLLVVNQYVLQFERAGAAGGFTDATFALDRLLPEDRTIYVTDWGMNATLQLTHQGRLHLRHAADPLVSDSPTQEQREQLMRMLSDSDAIWLSHVPGREAFQGVDAHLDRFASQAGYRREPIRTITDSNGRPVYQIFRFLPQG